MSLKPNFLIRFFLFQGKMVNNQNTELNLRMIDALKLNSTEGVPNQVSNNISPVIVINEIGLLRFFNAVSITDSITLTVPADRRWQVLYGKAEIVATATVGNRAMQFSINNNGQGFWNYESVSYVTAGQTVRWNLDSGAGVPLDAVQASGNKRNYIPIPTLCFLEAGATIVFKTGTTIDAADIAKLYLVIREFSNKGT
jgi:hypothetical protein